VNGRNGRVAAVLVLALLGLVIAATRPRSELWVVDASLAGPGAARLTLSSDVDVAQSHVTVTSPDGREVRTGPITAGPADVLTVPVVLDAGVAYTVGYHIIGADGAVAAGSAPLTPGAAGPAPAHDHGHGVDPLSAVLLLINFGVVVVVGWLLLTRPAPRR
jgi:methionine-rich copper-binding protein CopC